MRKSQETWDRFAATGRVEDYLRYRLQERAESCVGHMQEAGGDGDAAPGKGTGPQGTSDRRKR